SAVHPPEEATPFLQFASVLPHSSDSFVHLSMPCGSRRGWRDDRHPNAERLEHEELHTVQCLLIEDVLVERMMPVAECVVLGITHPVRPPTGVDEIASCALRARHQRTR